MINKVTLVGRLGKDPETKTLPSGKKYCRFSIATSESYKDAQGEWKEQTEWHNIIVWGGAVEYAEKFKKGDLIYVDGKITYNQWQDENGHTKYFTEIVSRELKKFVSSSGGGHSNAPEPIEPPTYSGKEKQSESHQDSDIPDGLPF